MNYNWKQASTQQGRERLKELADSGTVVFVKYHGREGMFYNVLATMPNQFGREERYSLLMRLNSISKPFDWYIEDGIEFLDPGPQQPQPTETPPNTPIIVVPFESPIDWSPEESTASRELMEDTVVDYIVAWARAEGKPMVTLSSGGVTIQCLINDPEREKPKK